MRSSEKKVSNLFDTDSMEPTEPVSTEAVAGLPPPSFSPSKLGHWLSPSPAFDSRSEEGPWIESFLQTIQMIKPERARSAICLLLSASLKYFLNTG